MYSVFTQETCFFSWFALTLCGYSNTIYTMSEEEFNKAEEIEEVYDNDNVDEDVNGAESHAHYQPKKDGGDDDTVKYLSLIHI